MCQFSICLLISCLLQHKQTALYLASGSGHEKVCQVLLMAGADVQATNHVSIRSSSYSVKYVLQR